MQEAPVYYSVTGDPLEKLGPAPSAEVDKRGRFVAETPGYYTVVAHSGPHASRQTVKIRGRNLQKKLELVGHGEVLDVYTSDLWIWEGIDGRDYAVTGTWDRQRRHSGSSAAFAFPAIRALSGVAAVVYD